MPQLDLIANARVPYINGLSLAYASTTTLTLRSGVCSDSNNLVDMSLASNTTLNGAINGLNGLDTGSLAASTFYYVFLISDSRSINPTGGLISLSSTAPLLPSNSGYPSPGVGYDTIRRVGVVLTDGSSHFLNFYQSGSNNGRTYLYDSMISVLSAGTSATFAAVSLAAAVPPLANTNVLLYASFTPNTAGDSASFRPTGSSATTVFDITGVVAAKAQDLQIQVYAVLTSSLPKIDYKLSSASDSLSLSVISYVDYI